MLKYSSECTHLQTVLLIVDKFGLIWNIYATKKYIRFGGIAAFLIFLRNHTKQKVYLGRFKKLGWQFNPKQFSPNKILIKFQLQLPKCWQIDPKQTSLGQKIIPG